EHGIAIEAREQRIDDVAEAATTRNVGHFDRQIPDVLLDPSTDVSGRILFEVIQAEDFAHHVVAVELDERVEVDQGRGNAGDEHHDVGGVVNGGVGRGVPPNDCGESAKVEFGPGAGHRDDEALIA